MRPKNKRIIFFTRYTRLGPSSRLRSYQYESFLKNENYEVTYCPLFNDRYIQELYARNPSKSLVNAIKCYMLRLIHIIRYVRKRHLIVVEKELLPYFPSIVEKFMRQLGVKFFLDIDDAIFHYYDQLESPFLKLILRKKMYGVFKSSFVVLAGNDYLMQHAFDKGARRVEYFPTVIDVNRYRTDLSSHSISDPKSNIVIGWIGSPSTIKYFKPIIPVLDELSEEINFKLNVVGSNVEFDTNYLNIEYFEWSEEKEIECISSFDIGIMPLQDSLFEKGKCGYKLIQYFGCEKPVVASPIGINKKIVIHGQNGFLAESPEDWKTSLKELISNEEKRRYFGREGYKKVMEEFNLETNTKRLIQLMTEAK